MWNSAGKMAYNSIPKWKKHSLCILFYLQKIKRTVLKFIQWRKIYYFIFADGVALESCQKISQFLCFLFNGLGIKFWLSFHCGQNSLRNDFRIGFQNDSKEYEMCFWLEMSLLFRHRNGVIILCGDNQIPIINDFIDDKQSNIHVLQ